MDNTISSKQEELLKKYGWLVHFVFDDKKTPYGYNIHTHGVEGSFGHKNIQIVFPLEQEIAHSILSVIIDRIKKGEVFLPGVNYSEIVNKYSVRFVEAMESGRVVLRLVFPGPNGEFDGEYLNQFSMLDNNDGLSDENMTILTD